MIVKIIDGNSISVKSEADDMVALRRAISVADRTYAGRQDKKSARIKERAGS